MKAKKLIVSLLSLILVTNLLTSCTETKAQETNKVSTTTKSVEKPFSYFNESESLVKTRFNINKFIISSNKI
jgi:hypothetical protein